MEYVCLAAGKGTRMGRLGRYLQKCMYPVGLRPFLEYAVANLCTTLERNGTDRLVLIVGHHGEQLRNYFGDRYGGLEIAYLEQREALGTGHALDLYQQNFRPTKPVIAWLADLYVPAALFAAVRAHPDDNVLTVAPGPEGESSDICVTLDDETARAPHGRRVLRAWRGRGPLHDIGLWKFTPEVLARLAEARAGEYRVLPNLQRCIDDGVRVGSVIADEWIHLGGTRPSPEENVRAVVQRLFELEPPEGGGP